MIKADREAKQQAASRDAGKDSSKKPAGGRTKVRLSHCSLCAALHAPYGPTVLQAVTGPRAITQIAKLTMRCEQISTKSGHISDAVFEPQPPLLIDDETPNDQVPARASCAANLCAACWHQRLVYSLQQRQNPHRAAAAMLGYL